MDEPTLDDILSSHVTGANIVWDGAHCLYRGIEIISLFGIDKPTAVWVRNAMPDNRDNWLKVEDPNFFEQFDKAIDYAKAIVDEVIKTETAMRDMRNHVFGSHGKPTAGRVG